MRRSQFVMGNRTIGVQPMSVSTAKVQRVIAADFGRDAGLVRIASFRPE